MVNAYECISDGNISVMYQNENDIQKKVNKNDKVDDDDDGAERLNDVFADLKFSRPMKWNEHSVSVECAPRHVFTFIPVCPLIC